jgi:hypothetical protein
MNWGDQGLQPMTVHSYGDGFIRLQDADGAVHPVSMDDFQRLRADTPPPVGPQPQPEQRALPAPEIAAVKAVRFA